LSSLLALFANNILPILLVSATGFLVGKHLNVDPRSVSQVAFYILTPCLVFNLLITNHFSATDVLKMSGFTIVSILCLGLLTWTAGYFFHFERRLLSAVLITTMFGNAGNFGLSLTLFAFGQEALAYASLYFVISAVLTYTIGSIVASLGSAGLLQSLRSLLKVPVAYAALLAVLFNYSGIQMPTFLERSISLLGNAAIPVLMVLLGIQLSRSRWDGHAVALSLTSFMRLAASPLLALGLSLVFGLTGVARQAGILEAAMPAAVGSTLLATEYDAEPSFVTSVVFVSTLLSPLTLTPLLAFLGA
jgi:predicted permease